MHLFRFANRSVQFVARLTDEFYAIKVQHELVRCQQSFLHLLVPTEQLQKIFQHVSYIIFFIAQV